MDERYKVSPTGKRIWATAESVLVSAEISWNEDGTFEYVGESKVHWDTQEQRNNEREEPLFEDEDGEEWPGALLIWNDEFEPPKDARVPKTEVACSNCDWTGSSDEVEMIEDIFSRVAPGEIMPYGECPKCGCLCHAAKDDA